MDAETWHRLGVPTWVEMPEIATNAPPPLFTICGQMCMEKIVTAPEELTHISRMELVEKAGAQGTEFLMWMMMRGALGDKVTPLEKNYHIPISNTGAGTMLLECAA